MSSDCWTELLKAKKKFLTLRYNNKPKQFFYFRQAKLISLHGDGSVCFLSAWNFMGCMFTTKKLFAAFQLLDFFLQKKVHDHTADDFSFFCDLRPTGPESKMGLELDG